MIFLLWGLAAEDGPPAMTPAPAPPIAATPTAMVVSTTPTRPVLPLRPGPDTLAIDGLRLSIARLQRDPDRWSVLLRLSNPSAHPITPNLALLRLVANTATQDGLAPLAGPVFTVGPGRVQTVLLVFPAPSREAGWLLTLPLRDVVHVDK